jgi:hypothetical protein
MVQYHFLDSKAPECSERYQRCGTRKHEAATIENKAWIDEMGDIPSDSEEEQDYVV